jgi:hypothetical protein
MASISDLRAGIATNLATIAGLRTGSTIPENVNPPFAIVAPSSMSYHQSFANGMTTYNFVVTLVVGRADGRSAQNALDAFCSSTGSSSIRVAVESNRTLGGKAFDCVVTGMRNYGSLAIGDNTYLAAEFDLTVQAD